MLEMVERPIMTRIYPTMSDAEVKSESMQTAQLLISSCALEDAHDNIYGRDSKNHCKVQHKISIQPYTGGIPQWRKIKQMQQMCLFLPVRQAFEDAFENA